MWELITGRPGQRLAVLITILCIQYSLGAEWDDIRIWSLMLMLIILEYLAFYHGVSHGVESILNLSNDSIAKLKTLLDAVESGEDVDAEDIKKIINKEENKDE